MDLFPECICVSSRLVPLLPQWPERGQEPLTQCLRASKAKTRTHGFFVALLEKHSEAVNKKQEPAVQISETVNKKQEPTVQTSEARNKKQERGSSFGRSTQRSRRSQKGGLDSSSCARNAYGLQSDETRAK